MLASRLIALGQAHDILMTGEGESADVRAVSERALRLHEDQRPGRFESAGRRVRTGSKAAPSLALVMHEFATNAAKYGALSEPGGDTVSIAWACEGEGALASIVLKWRKTGGPPIRRGFGLWLIARGLPEPTAARSMSPARLKARSTDCARFFRASSIRAEEGNVLDDQPANVSSQQPSSIMPSSPGYSNLFSSPCDGLSVRSSHVLDEPRCSVSMGDVT